VVYPQ